MSLRSRISWYLMLACAAAACAPELPAPALPLVQTPDAPFRKAPPPLSAPSKEQSMPAVQSAMLSNGVTLWVVNRPDVPYVALNLVAREAGTSSGAATVERIRFTARSVVEGGTVWVDQKVIKPPQLNGEQVRYWSGPTHSAFQLRVLSTSLPNGLLILGRTLTSPAFGSGNLDEVRIAELKKMQNASNSLDDALFEVTLDAALGKDITERVLGQNMEEVRSASPQAIERCYHELFRPETSALIAVGDVTLEDLLPLAERELAAWHTTLPRPPAPTRAAPRHLSNKVRVHFLPQSSLAQGRVALLQPAPPTQATQDELAFQLLANIAAGSLGSRSYVSLRHTAGITYGVEPAIWGSPELSLLRLDASFEAEEVVRAVKALQQMLEDLQTRPVSDGELSIAKVALLASVERMVHNNTALAQDLGEAFAEGKTPEWLGQVPALVAAISAADLQRVARRYLRPRQLEIGVAGPITLAPELRDLGEIELYQVNVKSPSAHAD
jgi:zinc protease